MGSFQGSFRGMFLSALRDSLDVPHISETIAADLSPIADGLIEIARQKLPDVSHEHVEMCALFAAAFTLFRNAEPATADTGLNRVVDRYGAEISAYTKDMLEGAADPFRRMVEESKSRERDFFGPSFQFERARDDDETYHLHVTSCAYHRLFILWKLPSLTRLFCRLDEAWIRAIDQDYGFRFERPATIGYGQQRCLFLFSRTSRNAAGRNAASPEENVR